MYQLEEKISVTIVETQVPNKNALVLNQLPLENADRDVLINAIGQFNYFVTDSILKTVGDVYDNQNVNDPKAQKAIQSMIKILDKHFERTQEINITADFDSARNRLVNQIKNEFQQNVRQSIQKGEFRIVFVPENELNDKSQTLIDDIETFLDSLSAEENDIACSSWGYTKLAESVQQISNRYPNLNITRIKRDLESRLYSSLTEQSQNFLLTVRQDMIQDFSQNPNLNNLFEQFTEQPANASETQVTKFYEFVDLFSSDKLRHVVQTGPGEREGSMSVRVENLLKKEDKKFTRDEIIQHLGLRPKQQVNFNDNIYTCEYGIYRHIRWLKSDIESKKLDFNNVIDTLMNNLKNYLYKNKQIKTVNINNQSYKVLHLKEYFFKIINQSLLNEGDYYKISKSIGYYEMLYFVKRYIDNYNLYYLGDKSENITDHPQLPNNERIKAADLIIRILDTSILPMTINNLANKIDATIPSVNTLFNKMTQQQLDKIVSIGNNTYTTQEAQRKYKTIMDLIGNFIVANQTTLQQFTTQANQNLGCNYRIEFYQSFLMESGYTIDKGLIS